MNRRALIIGSPDEKIPNVRVDMVNYRSFMQSPLGGTWRASEIVTLESPSRSEVSMQLALLKQADYSVVVFAGHGRHPIRSGPTMVLLRPDVEMDADELKVGAPKHTLILDCCRELQAESMLESIAMEKRASLTELSAENCRRYFDARIASCANGLVTMFSCSINEAAGESSEGGYYSAALIDSAAKWHADSNVDTQKRSGILDVRAAHDRTTPVVQRRSGNRQNPTIEYPRTDRHFPFAVIA